MARRLSPEVRATRALTRLHFGRRPARARRAAAMRDWRTSASWGWLDNIVGVGAGSKQVTDRDSGQPALTIFVRRKRARQRLGQGERIPERLLIESADAEVVTDVVEVGAPLAAQSVRIRPIQPGCAGAHFLGEEGTFGLFVRRIGRDEALVLSCSHVLARSGLGQAGDIIEQPLGGAAVTDPVATLTDVFSTITPFGVNTEDIALARIDATVARSPAALPSGVPIAAVSPLRAHEFPRLTPTRLFGAVSPDARGRTVTSEATFRVRDLPGVGDATFSGLVAYATESAGGDSGGVVVSEDGLTALGLHIGGAPSGIGVFQPLGPIFAAHGLELL